MICRGEGEEVLVELAQKLSQGKEIYNTRNMWFKKGDSIIRNGLRPLIQDLDSIPGPDYELENHYILNEGHVVKMDSDLLKRHHGPDHVTVPSRGCPYGCTYCTNNKLNKMYAGQRIVRKKSPDTIISELEGIKAKLPFLKQILFDDDCFFTYTEDEIRDFSTKYKARINIPLRIGGATPVTITKEKLSPLVDAGLFRIRMGIQTCAERTRKLYNRRYTNQDVQAAAKTIGEFKGKLLPTYDIILDNPWETEDDVIETLRFLTRLPGPYRLTLFSLTFYPGTDLFNRAASEGLITKQTKDYAPKFFYNYKDTYLNRVFRLLAESPAESKMPPWLMIVLTSKLLKRLSLHLPLYRIVHFLMKRGARETQLYGS
jgi:radical SAM superfamily enzyme YgiQ (UPF0313 family)